MSLKVGKDSVNETPLPEAVDAEGMDTLEFDLYLSDPAFMDMYAAGGMNSGLELTSSGYWDNQEISWTLAQIKANNQGGEIVEGWNHIVLPLDSAATRESDGNRPGFEGPFDITNVNFIRLFMVGEKSDPNILVKLDNICLTDRTTVTETAKKEALVRESISKEDALKKFGDRGETYKCELISELEDGTITTYTQGAFTDLCRGPHLISTAPIKAITLTAVAGAYWRGQEDRKQLTRIYGISFPKKKMLDEYLALMEEAM